MPVCHGSPFGGKIDDFQFWSIHDIGQNVIEFVKVCIGVNAVPIVSRHLRPFVIGIVLDSDFEVLAFPWQAAVFPNKLLDIVLTIVCAAKDNRHLDLFILENDCKPSIALVEHELHVFWLGIVQALCNAFQFECFVLVAVFVLAVIDLADFVERHLDFSAAGFGIELVVAVAVVYLLLAW